MLRDISYHKATLQSEGKHSIHSLCNHNDGDLFTCEDMKFSRESSLGISLVFIY